jgi:Rad3-related DNA helicase
MPDIKTQTQAIKWIKENYAPKLRSYSSHVEKMLDKYEGLKEKLQEFSKLAKQFELLDKHLCKVNRFLEIYDKDNWIFNMVPADGRRGRRLEFKPIDVAAYANDMLFKMGQKIILMSATILDSNALCEMLGLDKEDVGFISISSPFPVENRPVLTFPVGKMSAKEIDGTLPKLATAVESIMEQHSNDKGIIHCHTFKIARYLKQNIKSTRVLIHNSENREAVLERHLHSKEPTVLLSPSMTEGVDLPGEVSRFQVLCKVPFPYLGDKLIRKKMNKWKWWYPLQTAKTVVQAVGRSVRSDDDYAVTYILDSNWNNFYFRNKSFFPQSFHECLQ